MPRKLSFVCGATTDHYPLAAHAITTIGETKGYADGNGMHSDVDRAGDGPRASAGSWRSMAPSRGEVEVRTTAPGGCEAYFWFTWPALKLTSIYLTSCYCEGAPRRLGNE